MPQDMYLNIGCTTAQFKDITAQISKLVSDSQSDVEEGLGRSLNIIKMRSSQNQEIFQSKANDNVEKIITDAWNNVKNQDFKAIRIFECLRENDDSLTDVNEISTLLKHISEKFPAETECLLLQAEYKEAQQNSFNKAYELSTLGPMFSEETASNAIQKLSETLDQYNLEFDMSALVEGNPEIANSIEAAKKDLELELGVA